MFEKTKERVRNWAAEHPERVREIHKAWEKRNIEKERQRCREKALKWYWDHLEEAKERQKKRRANDPEKTKRKDKEFRKKHYEKNREKINQRNKKWREDHPNWRKERRHELGISKKYRTGVSHTKEYKKQWREEHKEEIRINRKKYKYNKKMAGKLTSATIQLIYEDNIKRFGTLTCYLCLKPIPFGKDHLEHKIPLSRGGTNEYNNLGVACQHCNNKKYNKTVEEFLS